MTGNDRNQSSVDCDVIRTDECHLLSVCLTQIDRFAKSLDFSAESSPSSRQANRGFLKCFFN